MRLQLPRQPPARARPEQGSLPISPVRMYFQDQRQVDAIAGGPLPPPFGLVVAPHLQHSPCHPHACFGGRKGESMPIEICCPVPSLFLSARIPQTNGPAFARQGNPVGKTPEGPPNLRAVPLGAVGHEVRLVPTFWRRWRAHTLQRGSLGRGSGVPGEGICLLLPLLPGGIFTPPRAMRGVWGKACP